MLIPDGTRFESRALSRPPFLDTTFQPGRALTVDEMLVLWSGTSAPRLVIWHVGFWLPPS